MPRAKKSGDESPLKSPQPPRAVPADADWGGYVNIRLSDDEKEAARLWIRENQVEVMQHLSDDLWDGFKFSLTADQPNQSFIATYTGSGWSGSKLRCALSARGATWFEALALLIWKHHVYAEKDWGQFRSNGTKVDPFG